MNTWSLLAPAHSFDAKEVAIVFEGFDSKLALMVFEIYCRAGGSQNFFGNQGAEFILLPKKCFHQFKYSALLKSLFPKLKLIVGHDNII